MNEFFLSLIAGVAGGIIVAACIVAGAFVDEWRVKRRDLARQRRERIDRMATIATRGR